MRGRFSLRPSPFWPHPSLSVMAEDERSWSFSSILESIQSVSRALETLKSEHESLLATVKTSEQLEDKGQFKLLIQLIYMKSIVFIIIDIDDDLDPEVVKETKEATLAQSINTLNKGLQEANVTIFYMNRHYFKV